MVICYLFVFGNWEAAQIYFYFLFFLWGVGGGEKGIYCTVFLGFVVVVFLVGFLVCFLHVSSVELNGTY